MYFLKINMTDDFFSTFSLTLFWFYCVLVFHKVFKEKWLFSILKGGVFCLLFIITLVIYKAIVFEITFALM